MLKVGDVIVCWDSILFDFEEVYEVYFEVVI